MAESVADDGRSIYELIMENNLDGIRSLLNPLTLRHRQSIVCQRVSSKNLLVHACERGFRDIVKYLLDECEADICERYTYNKMLSPLRISIDNVDVLMFLLLKSRGACAADAGEAGSCAAYALKKAHYSVYSILSSCADTREFLEKLAALEDTRPIFIYTGPHNIDSYLRALASGDVGRIKASLVDCIDPKTRNTSEEDALCVTIWNEKTNAEHFLLNYRVFTLKDHVRALELCGAKFIVFRSDLERGLRCWRKSIRIRNEHFLNVSDKFENKCQTQLLGYEFSCGEELDNMAENAIELYVQALIVYLRVLSVSCPFLQRVFVSVATHPVVRQDLVQTFKILAELAELPYFPNQGYPYPRRMAFDILRLLFLNHFNWEPFRMDDVLVKLRHIMGFIKNVCWNVYLCRPGEFHRTVYKHLLYNLLNNLIALGNVDHLGIDDQVWLQDGISQIMKWHDHPYPTTLLHLAVEEPTALPLIPFIILCSDDVNCRDNQSNTPMHIAANLTVDNDHLLRLVNMLGDAGGHLDSVNESGTTPLNTLRSRGVIGTL